GGGPPPPAAPAGPAGGGGGAPPAPAAPAEPAPAAATTPGGRRGRPEGATDKVADARNRRMVEAWEAGRFASRGALADHFKVSRTRASKVLKDAGCPPGPPCV